LNQSIEVEQSLGEESSNKMIASGMTVANDEIEIEIIILIESNIFESL
jgi:hypothetical protein